MPKVYKFWMVQGENESSPSIHRIPQPKVAHDSKLAAIEEAERLAIINPGKVFHILECIASCQSSPVSWWWQEPSNEKEQNTKTISQERENR
jgi:hypothetical protein